MSGPTNPTSDRKSGDWTLWILTSRLRGEDGFPYPVPYERLTRSSPSKAMLKRIRSAYPDMQYGVYRAGVAPLGLRLIADDLYPERSRLGEDHG